MYLRLLSTTFLAVIAAVTGAIVTQTDAPWGLQRISNVAKITRNHNSLDFTYTHNTSSGLDVDIYVLDSGVRLTHKDFEDRATFGASFVEPPSSRTEDVYGTGTHIAAIAAGKRFGVAKKANIISVKVVDDDGTRNPNNLISGLYWVLLRVLDNPGRRSVVLMTAAGGYDGIPEIDDLTRQLQSNWVHVVAAIGDKDTWIIGSPANILAVSLVGAAGPDDARPSWASYSHLADVSAPGVDIASAGVSSDTAVSVKSGSAQAAAHVAGIIAHIISKEGNYLPTYAMEFRLLRHALLNAVEGGPNGSKYNMAQLGPL